MRVSFFLDYVRDFVFPSGCACCDGPLLGIREIRLGVCADCEAVLSPEGGERCSRCGRPLVSERDICLECRSKSVLSYDSVDVLFRFGGAPRRLLESFKFGSGRQAAAFIARLFAERMRLNRCGETRVDPADEPTVVPVPPRPGKLKREGWDQVSAIASRLAAAEGFRVERCLRRLTSRTQKGLSGPERIMNVKGKIECVSPPPSCAVLIDDVLTTGATFDSCATTLKAAGCRRVSVLAFCYD